MVEESQTVDNLKTKDSRQSHDQRELMPASLLTDGLRERRANACPDEEYSEDSHDQ